MWWNTLTTYFIHRGGSQSGESLERLQTQRVRQTVVVVAATPEAEPYAKCLSGESSFTAIVEDAVHLHPGALRSLVRHLSWRRFVRPQVYQVIALIRNELTGNDAPGGVRVYWTEHLRRVGACDGSREDLSPAFRARVLGFETDRLASVVGDRPVGTFYEVYDWAFWDKTCARLGVADGPEVTVDEFRALYRHTGRIELLYAAAGVLDAELIRPRASGTAPRLGATGASLRFDGSDAEHLRDLLGHHHKRGRRRIA